MKSPAFMAGMQRGKTTSVILGQVDRVVASVLRQLYKGVVGTLIAKLQRLVRYYVFIMYYITYTNAILHETFISCRGRKNQSPRNCMILSWSIMVCVISWCITQQWNNRPMGHNAQQKGSKRVLQGLGNIPLKHRLRQLDITEYKASSKCAPADSTLVYFWKSQEISSTELIYVF